MKFVPSGHHEEFRLLRRENAATKITKIVIKILVEQHISTRYFGNDSSRCSPEIAQKYVSY